MYKCDTAITKRMQNKGIDLVFLGKRRGFDYSVIKKLRRIIKEFQPDIIHTHRYMLIYAVFAGSISENRKIFHTVHNLAEKEVPDKLQHFQKILFKTGKAIPVAISPIVKNSIIKLYELSPGNIPMIFNGIDLSRFKPKSDYTQHTPFTCLHIGRFSEQKNHETMLVALKQLIDEGLNVKFVFLGEGDRYEQIVEMANQMNIIDYIEFAGVTGDIRPYLDKSDLFMLPSKWEGMPITLIEAMAAGMPIIAAKVGGVPDMIENGRTGILISPGVKELAMSIQNLSQSYNLRRYIGMNARVDSKKFSVEKMGKSYLEIFE